MLIIKNINLPGESQTKQVHPRSGKADISSDNYTFSSINKTTILLRIMKDYSEFPPLKYFLRVLKSCPKCALIYVQIWKKKGKHMKVCTHKREVRKDYLVSPTVFRNLLTPLMFLNLIHFVASDDKFEIDVLGPHLND